MNSLDKTPLISLREISFSRDDRSILSDVNLDICQGDFIAITGPNGGGKTTLLRILLKLIRPDKGRVLYDFPSDSTHIGYLPQKNAIDSHFPISVREVIASGLYNQNIRKSISPEEREAKTAEMIKIVGLEGLENRPIGQLSGGQLQRTLLGRALISKPQILVLDEPLSYIDKRFESHFYEIIAAIKDHTTIVLVSHEMTAIAEMANRHLIVDRTIHECSAHHHYIRSECE